MLKFLALTPSQCLLKVLFLFHAYILVEIGELAQKNGPLEFSISRMEQIIFLFFEAKISNYFLMFSAN